MFAPGQSKKRRCLFISNEEDTERRVLLKRAFDSNAIILCRPRSLDRVIRRVRETKSESLKRIKIKYVSSWKDIVLFGASVHMVNTMNDVDVLIVDDFSSFFPPEEDVAGAVLETVSALCDAASFIKSDLMIGLINEGLIDNSGESRTPEKRNDRVSFVVSTCERVIKLFASHVLISKHNHPFSSKSFSSSSSSSKTSINLSLKTRLGITEQGECCIEYEKEKLESA